MEHIPKKMYSPELNWWREPAGLTLLTDRLFCWVLLGVEDTSVGLLFVVGVVWFAGNEFVTLFINETELLRIELLFDVELLTELTLLVLLLLLIALTAIGFTGWKKKVHCFNTNHKIMNCSIHIGLSDEDNKHLMFCAIIA